MSFDRFVDTKCPRECAACPQCEALNWVLGPHPYLMDYGGDEAVKCWKCSKVFWANEYFQDTYGDNLDDARIVKGIPDPVIPQIVLETLVDLAIAQRDALLSSMGDDPQDELLDYIKHIEDCANYVKELLKEGRIPVAEIPSDVPF